MADVAALLSAKRGSVTAPAGCGKTHLLVEAVAAHEGGLPILILTHTNAGVAALRARLGKLNVHPSKYRLSTLDGWGLRMLHAFPARSEVNPAHLLLNAPKEDYPAIREGVLNLLRGGHLSELIGANYSRLIVDEYQDCSPAQHEMVTLLAEHLDTVVLGDPLQAIFDFTPEGVVDWEQDVKSAFPEIGTLDKPWRWILAGNEELGAWLLEIREELLNGNQIDLRKSPDSVVWVQLYEDAGDRERRLKAANTKPPTEGGGSLIMAKWPKDQSRFAREIPGATKVENTDLSDLAAFTESFDPGTRGGAGILVNLAASVMTGVDRAALSGRIKSIQAGTNRNPPSDLENSILDFLNSPTYSGGAMILSEFSRQGGTRVFRQEMLRAAIEVLNRAQMSDGQALRDLFLDLREKARTRGRRIPTKAVGSTLLFKGLEAEVSIILEPQAMDHERDLYVALTRGSKTIVVCSTTPLLP
ncbi:UvrD-helicase domain-containing protein [Maricaulis maris]|uniref:UvrD-helicase domain-containing protein n=1 Tax=Maricaulis maris TaxID=74318 RepID=UPI0026EEED57|nr:UvrD-helicase domain-containing protein [Maricaulis maris]